MEQHFASLQGVVKAGQASASYASGEAWVPLGRRGRAKGQAWRARTHQCGFGATRNSARGVLCQAGRGGRRPRRDRAGRTPRPAARDALPPCVFRLKGDLDHLHNNNKTSALAAGASTLVPALRHLPPPLPRPPVPVPSLHVPQVSFGDRYLAPSGQLLSLPPRRLARPGAGSWPPLSSRKGAAAAEDAWPECVVGGPTRARRAAVAGLAAISQSGARRSPDLAGKTAPTAGPPDPGAAAATVHHPWYRQWPLYRPMRL
nr:uncharacterized protein LOC116153897 [Camelus dromedarius]